MNQYTIWANGKKQILFALVEKPKEKHCTTLRVFLVEGNQFVKEKKRHNICFDLIPRKTKKQDELEHAPKVRSLLIEFHDIILDNVLIQLLL